MMKCQDYNNQDKETMHFVGGALHTSNASLEEK